MYATPQAAELPLAAADSRLARFFEPPPDITASEWADAYRVMPQGTTSRPGQWRSEVYQREIMDVFDDPDVHEVVVVKCTQVGWSEILNNIIGSRIHLKPSPMMLVLPSLEDAKGYGKKRITPMIEACPVVKERVRPAMSRRGGNTLLLKEFPGGFLKLTGANSGKGLRSDPLPYVFYDEADAMPEDVDGEGHPWDIGDKRTGGYSNFKSLKGSTPALPKGVSRLEKLWDRSDQRRFHVPCPHCEHEQVLWWKDPITEEYRLVFERNEHGEVIPSSVQYICAGCRRGIQERHKQWMLDRGRWIATRPGRTIVGFHLNGLYRPWKENWADMAQLFVNAAGDNDALKEFITLELGEFWEASGTSVNASSLESRCEQYPQLPNMPVDYPRPWEYELVPAKVGVLVCMADIQENRIVAKIVGYGAHEESWLIAYEIFWGDPSSDDGVWEELEKFRLRHRQHESGAMLYPAITLVDSGDQSDAVYDYVLPRQNLVARVFAAKGVTHNAKPVLVAEGTTKRHNVRLFTVATHAAKERIMARLKVPTPDKPGFMHFPLWADEEYFKQLTSEKRVTSKHKRTRVTKVEWIKTYARNEVLDLEVLALAGLFVLQNYVDAVFRDVGAIAAALRGEVPLAPAPSRRVRGSSPQ